MYWGGSGWVFWYVHIYLLTGEIAMHLFYGFDPLVGKDTLQRKNYVGQILGYTKTDIIYRLSV